MTVDGAKLRSMRVQKGMSQEKLGLITNLSKRTIQRAENGKPIAIETLAFIAEALEIEPEKLRARQLDLFSDDTPPNDDQARRDCASASHEGLKIGEYASPGFYEELRVRG